MAATAIPDEIAPEQIDVPAPDAVPVAAADLSRRYGSFPVGWMSSPRCNTSNERLVDSDEGGSAAALVGLRR